MACAFVTFVMVPAMAFFGIAAAAVINTVFPGSVNRFISAIGFGDEPEWRK